MVSVCLPSDAFLQHLPSYLGFSYLGRGVSLHGCSSKVQPLLLTLDEGYLLTTAPPDLERGVAPLGPSVPTQPPLLRYGVAPLGRRPWPRACGSSSWQSVLRDIHPECSLEGLILKLKLQYFGHLMHTDDLLEKSLMLGKVEGRRSGQQMDGITNEMNMNLDKLREMVRDRVAWLAAVHGVTRSWTWLGNWTTTGQRHLVDIKRFPLPLKYKLTKRKTPFLIISQINFWSGKQLTTTRNMSSFRKVYNWLLFDIVWHYKNLEILFKWIFSGHWTTCLQSQRFPCCLNWPHLFWELLSQRWFWMSQVLGTALENEMGQTNIKIKCNHDYCYFWLTCILYSTLSRPCQLIPELLVYTNVSTSLLPF